MTAGHRRKGEAWERTLVRELRNRGWLQAERALYGTDQLGGDINGIPGWTFEAKSRKHGAARCAEGMCNVLQLTSWLKQANRHASSWRAAVLLKRPGDTSAANGYAILTVDAFLRLLQEAGYGVTGP